MLATEKKEFISFMKTFINLYIVYQPGIMRNIFKKTEHRNVVGDHCFSMMAVENIH